MTGKQTHIAAALVALAVVIAIATIGASPADSATRAVPQTSGAVALTFDDGPDPRFTPAILDILAEHEAKATFFVIGEHAEQHPDLIRRIIAEGHEVAHHTHTHPHVEELTTADLSREFDECIEVLGEHGIAPAWYRPPRKVLTPEQERAARARGMRTAMWTRTFERARFRSASQMASTLAEETREGDIVLAHDGVLDRSMTVEALPIYLERLEQRGIVVNSLGELTR